MHINVEKKTKNILPKKFQVCLEAPNWTPPNIFKQVSAKCFIIIFNVHEKSISSQLFLHTHFLILSNYVIFYCKILKNQRNTWFLLNVNVKPRFSEMKTIKKAQK